MFNQSKQGVATVLVTLMLSSLPMVAMAQAPYWDASGGTTPPNNYYDPNQGQTSSPDPYYAPPNQGPPQYNQYNQYSQQQPNNQYGQNYGPNQGYYGQQPQLKGYVSSAPAGTSFPASVASYISSQTAVVGDPVSVNLTSDLSVGSGTVLPAGTNVQGEVTSVRSAGYTGSNGQLQVRFTRAMLPDGRVIPLSAKIVTSDGSGIIKGGTTGQRIGNAAVKTVGGAALGAGLGAILGVIKGRGKADDYALRGAAIGGGGGLVASAASRGHEAILQPGMPLQLVLTQPLTVSAGAQGGGNYGGYQGY